MIGILAPCWCCVLLGFVCISVFVCWVSGNTMHIFYFLFMKGLEPSCILCRVLHWGLGALLFLCLYYTSVCDCVPTENCDQLVIVLLINITVNVFVCCWFNSWLSYGIIYEISHTSTSINSALALGKYCVANCIL